MRGKKKDLERENDCAVQLLSKILFDQTANTHVSLAGVNEGKNIAVRSLFNSSFNLLLFGCGIRRKRFHRCNCPNSILKCNNLGKELKARTGTDLTD